MKSLYILTISLAFVFASCSQQDTSTKDDIFVAPRDMGLASPEFTMPDPNAARVTLDNGLNAFVVSGDKAPLVTFTAMVKAGFANGKNGAGPAFAYLLRQNPTCTMDRTAFAELLYDNAMTYNVEINEEMIVISLNALSSDYGMAKDLFASIISDPCFRQAGIAGYGGFAGVDEASDVPNGSLTKAVQLFRQQLFEGHPFDNRTEPTARSISIADVKNYYTTYFNAANMAVGISGDINRATVEKDLETMLGQVPTGSRNEEVFTMSEANPATTIEFKTNKLQSWIIIGNALPMVDPADLPKLEVMNYIIGGGHFDTRLYKETRDLRGLTNDASGFPEWKQTGPGMYTFRTYGRPEVAGQLIELVNGEIAKIRSEKVTEEELFVATGALADGVFPMLFENSHTTAQTFAEHWCRYQGFENLSQYQERVRAVTIEDVQQAAKQFLQPSSLTTITLVSPER